MYSNGKFKRGDYVLRVDGENFKSGEKMKYIYSIPDKESVEATELNGTWRNEDVRHATQEELYWMKTLERDYVGDFKVGDIIVDEDDDRFTIYSEDSIRVAQRDYSLKIKGIYPTESYKHYPQEGK